MCSRVTFVNFTVTPSSLENQCLNLFLKSERPDIEALRIQQMKIQGEYAAKLRSLEDELLDELSNSEGNILDNEQLINTLERLKVESKEVTQAINDSEQIIEQIQEVTSQYTDIAYRSSKLYFSMY